MNFVSLLARVAIICPLGQVRPVERVPAVDRPVTTYTKVWTDSYHNYNKVVYSAYTKALKDETGDELTVEVWHGAATGYYENGNKAWEVEYRHGKREGTFTSWADNGVTTGVATFRRGLMEGEYVQWSDDGHKMREATYENGKTNGESRYWDTDGQLLTTGTYREGKPWEGTVPELSGSPGERSIWVIRRYEGGKKVSEKKLTGNWWW